MNIKVTPRERELISKLVDNLSLNDWREIRVGDYHEERDSLKGREQLYYVLNKITEWKKKEKFY